MAAFTDKQLMYIAGSTVLAGVVLYMVGKRKVAQIAHAVDPTNPNNVVRDGFNDFVEATTGRQDAISSVDAGLGKVFAVVDLINPFATDGRKQFAKQELGIGNEG